MFKNVECRKNFIFIILILLVFALFYRDHLLGKAFIPFDSKSQVYQFAIFVSQAYRSGEVPLWNPYIYSGSPSFADPLYMMFYPGTFLFLIPTFLTQSYFDLIELLHIFIGGVSVFLLLKDYNLSRWAALAAAVLFMLGGPLTGRIQHVTQIYAVSLFPLIILLIRKGFRQQMLAMFGLAGFVLGSILMIGYQPTLLFCFVLLAYCIFEYSIQKRDRRITAWKLILYFGFMLVIAIGFSAIQVLPTLEFASLSSRPEFDYASASKSSVPPMTLLTLIFPNIFFTIQGKYWGPINISETYLFIGLIPIFFIFFSFFNWKYLSTEHKFYLIISIFSLFYALGKHTPLYPTMYTLFPPIRLFRRPSDALFIFQLGISISLGFALNLWIRRNAPLIKSIKEYVAFILLYFAMLIIAQSLLQSEFPGIKIQDWFFIYNFFPIIILLVCILLKNRFSTINIFIILVIGICVDLTLTSSNSYLNSSRYYDISNNSIYECSDVVDKIKGNLGDEYRFEAINAGGLWSNAAVIWKKPSSIGYSPLVAKKYVDLASPGVASRKRDFTGLIKNYNSRWFDLLGVKLIISSKQLNEIDPNVDLSGFNLIPSSCYLIYENIDPIPFAYLVNKISLTQSASEALLIVDQYDLSETVFLEDLPADIQNNMTAKNKVITLSEDRDPGVVDILRRTYNNISLQTSSSNNSILVINDVNYPGWKVFIDDQEVQLLTTNFAFKGVYLPAGVHTVDFIFEPNIFRVGACITLSTIILFILSLLFYSVNNRKNNVADDSKHMPVGPKNIKSNHG